MIDRKYLLEWAHSFPWSHDEFVEQDLLISRCIVAIYSDPFLASRLAWRGGTALYKLYVKPQPRYSEDIDLVLINPEPMGPILDRLREVLSFIPDRQAEGESPVSVGCLNSGHDALVFRDAYSSSVP